MANGQLDHVLRHIHRLAGAGTTDDLKDGQLLERFVAAGEEAAFAALLRRHGPLVLGVCRRVLRDRHAAEDAFQATFLVLLRRAHALDRRGSLANWLYTVAYHVALRARAEAARRQRQERQVAEMHETVSPAGQAWPDLQPVLDEELSRLPDSYRAAVLLCYLQGRTNAEAAQLLGWPVGTVKGRLARARDLLRRRLARRGLALTGAALTTILAENATAAVPTPLAQATVQAAAAATGLGASAAASPTVISLAEGALKAMFVTKTKIATAFLLIAGLMTLGVGALADPGGPRRVILVDGVQDTPAARTGVMIKPLPVGHKGKVTPQVGTRTLTGQVKDNDKRPLAGARVSLVWWPDRVVGMGPQILGEATTDRQGKFRLVAKAPPLPVAAHEALVAGAPGHGPGWGATDAKGGADITLPPEQVIRGRLIDLQGLPAAHVKLQVSRLGSRAPRGQREFILTQFGDVDDDPEVVNEHLWVVDYSANSIMMDSDRAGRININTMRAPAGAVASVPASAALAFPQLPKGLSVWPETVTTDDQGRFVLRGVGRDQGVGLQVRDERFALQSLDIPPQGKDKTSEVPLVAQPQRILEGTVTDAASGRPLPNARLHVRAPGAAFGLVQDFVGPAYPDWRGRQGLGDRGIEALTFAFYVDGISPGPLELPDQEVRTDDRGKFRLPLFQDRSYSVRVTVPGQPYLPQRVSVEWPKGEVVRHQVNVRLVRGVPVRGKVIEEAGGKGVVGVRVDFWCKGLKLPPGVRHPRPAETAADGTFEALLPPGAWHLLANAPLPNYAYSKIASDRLLDPAQPAAQGAPKAPAFFRPDGWVAFDVKAGDSPREVGIKLRRAPLLRGRLVGPDGQPVAHARLLYEVPSPAEAPNPNSAAVRRRLFLDLYGALPPPQVLAHLTGDMDALAHWTGDTERRSVGGEELPDGRFALPVQDPEGSYRLLFFDATGCLAAVRTFRGDQAGGAPVTVPLDRCGAARVRFKDAQGKPLANYRPLMWLIPATRAPKVTGDLKKMIDNGLRADNAVWLGRADPLHYGAGPRSDAEGRLTLSALVPGATYRISLANGKAHDFTVQAGQTQALPDLVIDHPELTTKLPSVKAPAGK
jgi:RNA polymerase sigma factor (sigma-70 family)